MLLITALGTGKKEWTFDSYFPDAFAGRTELGEDDADDIAATINSEVNDNSWASGDDEGREEADAAIRQAIVANLARHAFKTDDATDAQIKQVESITSFTSKVRPFDIFDGSDVSEKWEGYAADLND
jgi:hypothetical protein